MIQVAELAYVRVQVPDLRIAEKFFLDFGLVVRDRAKNKLYLRGTGPEHHLLVAQHGERQLLSVAYEVADARELEKASELQGASQILQLDDSGGGQMVTLRDPDGNWVELVYGMAKTEPIPVAVQHFNSAAGRESRRNAVVRPTQGPSRVMRIGHVVLRTLHVQRLTDWYQNTLGFLESDIVPSPDRSDLLMSFVRLNRGGQAVDHHVLQLLKGMPNQLHHISFEVQDIDDLQTGHHSLIKAGYTHMWGVGRHLQGSQIFDYWLDPFGTMYEHWIDTDVLDSSVATCTHEVTELSNPWGPTMPPAFLDHGTN